MTTMPESLLRLHFLLMLFLCLAFASRFLVINASVVGLVACPPHQIQALTEFKNEFDSSSCNLTDYFNGVWCDYTTGAITKFRLPSGCLSGTLKPNSSLFGFHQLRYLKLSNNNFKSSSLHSEFGKLNRLEVLSLYSNGFLGQIPSSFRNLSMLSHLDISYNHLSETLNPNNSLFQLHHLTYLDLSHNNFASSLLPSELGNLNNLKVLSLSSNSFFGQVPPTISNLTLLTELYLDTNELTGSFPLVRNLTKLSFLILAYNHFSGTIPPLFTMPFLSHLDLRQNYFSGPIQIPNSSFSYKLELLFLGNNHFEGQILEPILKLINLKRLDLSFLKTSYSIDLTLFSSFKFLSYLDLSGISISLASLSSDSIIPLSLEVLFLKQCGISEFPNILKTLQNLEFISLRDNIIKGKIPAWLWGIPRLSLVFLERNLLNGFEGSMELFLNSSVQILDLTSNSFEGELPNLPLSIISFFADDNIFKGDIPLSICNGTSLAVLSLSYNNFTGPISPCLSNLVILNLRRNNLKGSIPNKFSVNAPLRTLDVGYNQLTGKLPRSLLNCSFLKVLTVDYNKIKDTFPLWLKVLQNLQVLTLRSNQFYGPISHPHQGPLGFPELRIFEISDNKFTGNLPPSYFVDWKASSPMMKENGGLYMVYDINHDDISSYTYTDTTDLQYKGLSMKQKVVLTSYATIDFSGNTLEGQIPESIGFLKELIALNLSNNAFTGHIPLSFANLTELESLDLSKNKLSRTIPNGLRSLSFLAYINVSHNQLKGEIPQGTQITGQPKSSFEGNARLCGLPLKETCFDTNAPPTQDPKEEDGEEEQMMNWKAVAIGYGSGLVLGLAIAQLIASYKSEWLVKIIGSNTRRVR